MNNHLNSECDNCSGCEYEECDVENDGDILKILDDLVLMQLESSKMLERLIHSVQTSLDKVTP